MNDSAISPPSPCQKAQTLQIDQSDCQTVPEWLRCNGFVSCWAFLLTLNLNKRYQPAVCVVDRCLLAVLWPGA